jgi:predicted RNase H-like HicB family nuclease
VVIVSEPEGGYSVFVPELPSVATQGETIEEARANALEAIECHLEVMHEDGLPIPTLHRDRVAVHVREPRRRPSAASSSARLSDMQRTGQSIS